MFNNAREVIEIIRDELMDYESVIFLGAGGLGLEQACFDLTKDIIAYEWADDKIAECKAKGVWAIKKDITELKAIEADVVTFFDVLEHLLKEDALAILNKITAQQIVMFIPVQDKYRRDLDELKEMQSEAKTNNKQMTQHLSLWTPEELEALGFKVWYKEKYFGEKHNHWGACIAIKNNV
jgi:hypothetical protein